MGEYIDHPCIYIYMHIKIHIYISIKIYLYQNILIYQFPRSQVKHKNTNPATQIDSSPIQGIPESDTNNKKKRKISTAFEAESRPGVMK